MSASGLLPLPFFAELQSGFVDEELSPEEERERMLEIEVRHLKRKFGDDWKKYYPYWMDPDYDDDDDDEAMWEGPM